MKGFSASITKRFTPLAIRRRVASARGFLRVKMEGPRSLKSMQSAAVTSGSRPGAVPWVGAGHWMAVVSRRAIRNRRLRLVPAPKSLATSLRCSTV